MNRLPICLLTCLLLITLWNTVTFNPIQHQAMVSETITPLKSCENEQLEPEESTLVFPARKRQSKLLGSSWLTNQHKHTLTTTAPWLT